MTEITRVPLHPIAKGSLTKMWIGVIVAIVLGVGVAFAAVPQGVKVTTLEEGTGPTPQMGDVVFVQYAGTLPDGTEFDRSQPSPFPPGLLPDGTPMLLEEGAVIPGFLQGMLQMHKGGHYRLKIPSDLAYGASPPQGSPIPANSDLTFDVTLVDFMTRAEAEQRVQAMQQMMMQRMQGQGGPQGQGAPQGPEGAAPPPVPMPAPGQ